jgi:hypothetical protein
MSASAMMLWWNLSHVMNSTKADRGKLGVDPSSTRLTLLLTSTNPDRVWLKRWHPRVVVTIYSVTGKGAVRSQA